MVSLLDEIESQVRDRKIKKDKALLMQNTQMAAKDRIPEIATSQIHGPSDHRTGGIASNSVPHIKPVSSLGHVPMPLTPSSNQTTTNAAHAFSAISAPKSQMVIVPKDKLNPAGPNKLVPSSATNLGPTSAQVNPPKNTPVSTTKITAGSNEAGASKQLYIGAYTKIGGFQQRSSSNDGPTKGESNPHTVTNPLVSPRKPHPDGPAPVADKPSKPITKTGFGNPSMTGVNPARELGMATKKPAESSVSSGANKSSGTAISAGNKKPLNLFGLKFLSKGPSPAYGERR